MRIKDLIKQSYEDLKNLTINWFNILVLVAAIFILSNIITPIAGVPIGLLGGAYYLKRREEKENK
ncbi:VraH family protein [Staphylococcus caprae]|uniref:VraH family peptide resistance protein n=1 Tax=Staphylococcus caprae TaxID=29380 RepID=UPI0019D16C2C|nr:VraH family protein [Staphylococcus caprae]MBN6826689.1 VraH family protein [Staphylococcus caprae]